MPRGTTLFILNIRQIISHAKSYGTCLSAPRHIAYASRIKLHIFVVVRLTARGSVCCVLVSVELQI